MYNAQSSNTNRHLNHTTLQQNLVLDNRNNKNKSTKTSVGNALGKQLQTKKINVGIDEHKTSAPLQKQQQLKQYQSDNENLQKMNTNCDMSSSIDNGVNHNNNNNNSSSSGGLCGLSCDRKMFLCGSGAGGSDDFNECDVDNNDKGDGDGDNDEDVDKVNCDHDLNSLYSQNCNELEESCLLGIDCNEKTTVGLVLRILADTTIRLDGDG